MLESITSLAAAFLFTSERWNWFISAVKQGITVTRNDTRARIIFSSSAKKALCHNLEVWGFFELKKIKKQEWEMKEYMQGI